MRQIIKERIEKLRQQMKLAGVNAWYISGTDPHQSEYMAGHWQARSFITGFTGSAGIVVITEKEIALWTDSRYFLQAENELEGTDIQLMKMKTEGTLCPAEWLEIMLDTGNVIGVDSSCMSISQYESFKMDIQKRRLQLKHTEDLLSSIWGDRPPLPNQQVFEHELKFAGLSRIEKFAKIRTEISNNNADATLITALDDLAWTFNLRGEDVDFNPVFIGFGFISLSEIILFINLNKIPVDIQQKLENDGISILPYEAIYEKLKVFSGTLTIDPDRANQALIESLSDLVKIVYTISVPTMLKSIKSEKELKHIRETMRKDGIAMIEFLFWLDQAIQKQRVTEYDIAQKLDYFRSLQEGYKGASFFPIVGYKQNGAIIHRSVTLETADIVNQEGMLLFDSGGQYLSGTTDITRTISLGKTTQQQRTDFTLVLKGMIAISKAKFPSGTNGCNLDILARKALWENGLNYGHGTSHGIGYFLNVHEGPANIRQEFNEHSIKPGMVLSNEPGCYREGQYGIRIENVIACQMQEKTQFGQFYGFETLSLCPIDINLIDINLLNEDETIWVNEYHQRCFNELSPFLNDEKKHFLEKITPKLG